MKIARLLLVIGFGFAGSAALAVDDGDCAMCHPGQRAAGAHGSACASCHGDATQHVENPRKNKPELRYMGKEKSDADALNAPCLGCHEDAGDGHWHTSPHADSPCASCHSIHGDDRALDASAQLEMCLSCHVSVRHALVTRSRHPLREGAMNCSSCHEPHGALGDALVKAVHNNDLCYGCHMDKRGPFLWEHAPVTDDCGNCHDPHGSVHGALLTQRTPFLCQQCHAEQFHPSTVLSGRDLTTGTSRNKLVAEGCLNCHWMVHGSNHPSGARLTR